MSPNEAIENEIIDNINAQIFFKEMTILNLNRESLFTDIGNINRSDIELLNSVITKCKEELKLTITECILVLDEYILDAKKAVTLLNDKNYKELRRELVKKYNIKNVNNTLSKFFKKI